MKMKTQGDIKGQILIFPTLAKTEMRLTTQIMMINAARRPGVRVSSLLIGQPIVAQALLVLSLLSS
jgi:hypothetical protein